MKITIYQCDICKTESSDMKAIYAPKSGASVAVLEVLRQRFKYEDLCTNCFNEFNNAITEAVNKLKVVDKL